MALRAPLKFGALSVIVAASAASCGDSKDSGLFVAGDGGPDGTARDGSTGAACVSDKECTPLGLLCDKPRGVCVECLTSATCGDDRVCLGSRCVAVVPCETSLDCARNEVCDTAAGWCVECLTSNDCAMDEVCVGSVCERAGAGGASGAGGSGGTSGASASGGASGASGTGGTSGASGASGASGSSGSGGCNSGAFDLPGNGVDEDCSGQADDEPTDCAPVGTPIESTDPLLGARAIGLCRMRQGASWGLVSAKYVLSDGTTGMNPRSHGILAGLGSGFGPREGTSFLALSTGTARPPGHAEYASPSGADMMRTGNTPTGQPAFGTFCPTPPTANTVAQDPAALEVVVRTPTNTDTIQFDFSFLSFEFPLYVCAGFNDMFVAMVSPEPTGALAGNVAFDSQRNPISVNTELLDVCNPQTAGGVAFPCVRGSAALTGTGFDVDTLGSTDPHGATGWLRTSAPVPPGTDVTVRFAIWDSGDAVFDSTVLIDRVTFRSTGRTTPETVRAP